jgi:4'-phosphopantetheinyl transferase
MGQVKIINHYPENIDWMKASSCEYLINNHTDIWRINISSNIPIIDNLLPVLKPEEITRANRFFYARDKNRYIISHGAMRNILGKYLNQQPSLVEFEYGINEKPYINNEAGLHFNLSHSGDWALLAIANSEIGVDTELIKYDFDYKDIMDGYFGEDEINYINEDRSAERFFLLWTRKEAQIKATGKGLSDDIKLIPGLAGMHRNSNAEDWLINSFNLTEHYIASVAANPLTNEIKFWDF